MDNITVELRKTGTTICDTLIVSADTDASGQAKFNSAVINQLDGTGIYVKIIKDGTTIRDCTDLVNHDITYDDNLDGEASTIDDDDNPDTPDINESDEDNNLLYTATDITGKILVKVTDNFDIPLDGVTVEVLTADNCTLVSETASKVTDSSGVAVFTSGDLATAGVPLQDLTGVFFQISKTGLGVLRSCSGLATPDLYYDNIKDGTSDGTIEDGGEDVDNDDLIKITSINIAAKVVVQVVDESGNPISGVTVEARAGDCGSEPIVVSSDENGNATFTISDLGVGAVPLFFSLSKVGYAIRSCPDLADLNYDPLIDGSGQTKDNDGNGGTADEDNTDKFTLNFSAKLLLQVKDNLGNNVEGATVAIFTSTSCSGSPIATGTTGSDGKRLFTSVDLVSVSNNTPVFVTVTKTGYISRTCPSSADFNYQGSVDGTLSSPDNDGSGTTADTDNTDLFTITFAGKIVVQVQNALGANIGGATVNVFKTTGCSGSPEKSSETSTDGKVIFTAADLPNVTNGTLLFITVSKTGFVTRSCPAEADIEYVASLDGTTTLVSGVADNDGSGAVADTDNNDLFKLQDGTAGVQFLGYEDTTLEVQKVGGVGKHTILANTSFKIVFRYTETTGKQLSQVKLKFDINENGVFDASDETVTLSESQLIEVDENDTNVADGKDYKALVSIPFTKNTAEVGNVDRIYLAHADSVDLPIGSNRLRPQILVLAQDSTAEVSAEAEDLIVKDNYPTLTSQVVSPTGGNTITEFTFEVKYTDADNNEPKHAILWIDLNKDEIEDSATEYFSLSKKDINDTTFADGAIYTVTVKNIPVGTYSSGAGKFIFSDGFKCGIIGDEQGCDGSGSGKFVFVSRQIPEFTVTEQGVDPQEDAPQLDYVGIAGLQLSDGCKGVVEPDGSATFASGSKIVLIVKYTSPVNNPAQSIRAYLDFGLTQDGISDSGETEPLTKLQDAQTINNWENVSQSVKDSLVSNTALYDGDYLNGEIYFAEVSAFGPKLNILKIEASDGKLTDTLSFTPPDDGCVKVKVVDSDGDGLDDTEEEEGAGDDSKIVLSQENDLDGKDKKVVCEVTAGEGETGTPKFTSGSRPCTLTNIKGEFGVLPDDNLSMIGCMELNVQVSASGRCAKLKITMPAELPAVAKIYKLNTLGVWVDVLDTESGLKGQVQGNKVVIYEVCDGSLFDLDATEGNINDPLGFFFSNGETGDGTPPAAGGGGGGCYVNPRFGNYGNNGVDGGLFLLHLLMLSAALWAVYRFSKSLLRRNNLYNISNL